MQPGKTFAVTLILFVALLNRGMPAAAAPESAGAFIQALADETIAVIADETLSSDEREQAFARLFDRGFDLPTISRFVLGRHWRTASEAEREEYQRVFRVFIVKSYSRRFSSFSGERLEVKKSRKEADGRDTIVDSTIERLRGRPTRVAWRVRRNSDELRIVDVVVEGVSMAITQRDEFASVIRSSGGTLEGLIARLRRQIEKLD